MCPTVENTQLTLNLQTENKGGVVSGGELTIFLDGPTVDLGSVPNGSAVTDGECRPAPQGCAGMGGAGWARQPEEVPRAGFSSRYLGVGTAQHTLTLLSIADPHPDMLS